MRRWLSAAWLVLLFSTASAAPEVAGTAAEAVIAFHRAPGQAIPPLKRAIQNHPVVADALQVLLGEAQLAAGDHAAAARTAQAALAAQPPWRARLAWLLVRAAQAPQCAAARAALKQVRVDHHHVTQAALRGETERLIKRCEGPKALAVWRAEQQISAPEKGAKTSGLSEAQQFERATAFEAARDYAGARAALLPLTTGAQADRAHFELARISLDRTRDDFVGAAAAFGVLAGGQGPYAERAAYQQARALGRAGQLEAAVAAYAAVAARWPGGRTAEDAQFFAAFLQYEGGAHLAAAQAFAVIQAGRWADASRWYHAWCLVLAEQPEARAAIEPLATGADLSTARGRQATYWWIQQWKGYRPLRAATRAVALVEADPFAWYALLLRRQYPGVFSGISTPQSVADVPVPAALEAPVARIEALVAAGLPRFARSALERLAPVLVAAGQGALLLALAERAEAPNLAMRTALRSHRDTLRTRPRPSDPSALVRARRAAWPRGFDPAVRAASTQFGVEPALIRAFIRKESAYRPEVVSRAHAVGLMQIIEPTARRIRADAALANVGHNLFDPVTNITHGAWYVRALSRRFSGQLPLLAAGYNAGPGAVQSWVRAPSEATDRFVERMPFKEARLYVKRLTASYMHYRVFHDGATLDEALSALPLTLNLQPKDGVAY
jgi:soluble lytic murein transglycosylase